MHITRLAIKNIRSLEAFTIELHSDELAGWHVIIGSNASGKTTVIRSLALALIGRDDAIALRENWKSWLRYGESFALVNISWALHDRDSSTISDADNIKSAHMLITDKINEDGVERILPTPLLLQRVGKKIHTDKGLVFVPGSWPGQLVFFSASYGPFRRFGSRDRSVERLYASSPRVAPHLTAFGEDVPLTAGLEMIQSLHIKALEGDRGARRLVDRIQKLVNDTKLLPFGARIVQISSDEVWLEDGNGCRVGLDQMSSGFKSVLSLFFDILHQMVNVFGTEALAKAIDLRKGTIGLPGIVSIDEVDAHLHPSWQRDIGGWFTHRFPRLQFFVTTHSPIICRAATSVWKLPDPGSGDPGGRVTGADLNRLIYGSVIDAYGTELFGVGVAESDQGRDLSTELSRLNRKALTGKLTAREAKRMMELRATLPSRSSDTLPE